MCSRMLITNHAVISYETTIWDRAWSRHQVVCVCLCVGGGGDKTIDYGSYICVDMDEKTGRRKTYPLLSSGLLDIGISSVNYFLHNSVAVHIFCSMYIILL